MFYAYMLRCSDGSYCGGHTEAIEARLYAHQNGVLKGYTSTRRPVTLVWVEGFESRDEAFRAERRVKGWSRAKKEALIRQEWPELIRLAAVRGPAARRGPSGLGAWASAHPSSASG